MFFLSDMLNRRLKLPASASEALPGRPRPIRTAARHHVSRLSLYPPFPDGLETAILGMGSFWGPERLFWETPGVHVTVAGYCGGFTPNPTFQEVATGQTGHAEVVLVVFDPVRLPFTGLLRIFWENHDPTQGMRQGADIGTPYRSTIRAVTDGQLAQARASCAAYAAALEAAGAGRVTTEVAPAGPFYRAEAAHQQYLARNPGVFRRPAGTGVAWPGSVAGG